MMFPQAKQYVAINNVSKTAGNTASGLIDCLGYDYATIDVVMTTADAVSNKPSVLKLQEADDTNASNLADITGARAGTDFTNPAVVTSGNNTYKFNVDLRGRKRYLNVVVVPATTQITTAIANLLRGEQAPITATKANALALVEI